MSMEPGNPVVGGGALRYPMIESPNFISGVQGWIIRADGTAEFQNGVFRGSISASAITGATITGGTIDGATITGSIFRTSASGQRIQIDALGPYPTIWFYPGSGPDYAFINSYGTTNGSLGLNSGTGGGTNQTRLLLTPTQGILEYNDITTQVITGGYTYVDASGWSGGFQGTGSIAASATSSACFFGSTNLLCNGSQAQVQGGGSYLVCTSTTANLASGAQQVICGPASTAVYGGTVYIGAAGTVTALASSTINLNNIGTNTGTPLVSNGRSMYIQSSSLRYKTAVRDAVVDPEIVLGLRPITYADKNTPDGPHYYGLIAEELADGPLDMLVYRDDGVPSAIAYDRLPVVMIPLLRNLYDRVSALEAA